MRIVMVRREAGVAFSMDVYTNNLVAALKQLRPSWEIVEVAPDKWSRPGKKNTWHAGTGLRKYYERFWRHPRTVCGIEGDLYHIVDHSNAHVAYWLQKLKKPVVVTCHDLVQFIYPEILKGQSRFPAVSMASWQYSVKGMNTANCVVTVSENTAKDVQKILGIESQRIRVIPNGVATTFQPLPEKDIDSFRQQYQRSPNEICLLNVGSTHQRKNILTVLNVLKTLKEKGIPVRLWRTGDKFMADQAEFISQHNLQDDILDVGLPGQDILIQLYNAADILLAPSLYEGFGLTVLEAMSCGLPVITSNVSSLPEVVGDAAIMVDPMDTSAICDAILHIHQNQAYRQTLIQKGLLRAKGFTWYNAAERLACIYEQLVEQKQLSLEPLESLSEKTVDWVI
jgi:glycosyltransferase involved in cell wall biosynthesis